MLKRAMLIILVIIISINVSSCGGKAPVVGNRPTLIDVESIESVEHFDIYTVVRSEIAPSYISASEDEFKKLFDIILSITAEMSIDTSGTKSAAQVKSTGADGLYMFPYASISRISELAEDGSIIPIEKYLMENPVWNELPAAMRKMYEASDGHIWALPRGFTPVVNGRVFRADYLNALELDVPTDLDSLYEVSKALAFSDPDKNGLNDTYGMAYSNANEFRDIFYANGVPINTSNDGYQRTSITYNQIFESFEDSMLMDNMIVTLEYISKLEEEGILRRLSGRYSSNASNFSNNNSIANAFIRVPGYAFTDEKYVVVSGISGSETKNLNPLSYDFYDGFYLLGANTENPGATINSFVSLMFGDIDAYLFASKGIQGETYNINMGTVEVIDKNFFSQNRSALIRNNPLYTYETMDISLNTELATSGILSNLINNEYARDIYIDKARESEIIYDITIELAYPEVFKIKQGEIVNSAAGTMFDTQFSRIISGRVSIEEAINIYKRNMKKLGMQDIINELNLKIGAVTKFHY